jgi:hypothetical protein
VPLRVRTNGLVLSRDSVAIATELTNSGVDLISIGLMSDNPKQYSDIMKPTDYDNKAGFGDVCSFVIACVEAGA